jgi:hypothetical protein
MVQITMIGCENALKRQGRFGTKHFWNRRMVWSEEGVREMGLCWNLSSRDSVAIELAIVGKSVPLSTRFLFRSVGTQCA